MDFAFTNEQNMIRDSAESFLQEVSTSAAIRAAMATDSGYDASVWRALCSDLYWQASVIPEQFGGLGLGMVELISLQEQMGRFLFCSPFFSSVCSATLALLLAANEQQQSTVLPRLIAGETATLAFVGDTPQAPTNQWHSSNISARCEPCSDGQWLLNGSYRYVVDGASADWLIVAARDPAAVLHLFVIAGNQTGITRSLLPTLDQTRKLAQIQLQNVLLSDSARLAQGSGTTLDAILNMVCIALAAEQMGAAQRLLDMTVDYTNERVQFGRPIAGFQAIKHKAADMMTRVEVARSGVYYAACVADQVLQAALSGATPDYNALTEAASIAKSYCSDAYFKNAAEALQMHGGVGFTWEYDVHLFFKRAKASQHLFGSGDDHRERLARMLLDEPLTEGAL